MLILDQTPHHNESRGRKLTVDSRQRAWPLCCVGYTLGGQPEPMPELVVSLLPRVAACLLEGAEATLLANGGLAWPHVVDTCHERGWQDVWRC